LRLCGWKKCADDFWYHREGAKSAKTTEVKKNITKHQAFDIVFLRALCVFAVGKNERMTLVSPRRALSCREIVPVFSAR